MTSTIDTLRNRIEGLQSEDRADRCAETVTETALATDKKASSAPQLYDFQKACIGEIYQHIRNHCQRILLIAPCATGKTTMAAWIMRDATQKASQPMRCMFLVSLNCLLEQTAETLQGLGVNCSILQGSRSFDPTTSVIVASIQTIRSRLKKNSLDEILGKVGVIFVDECHWLAYDKVFSQIHDHYLKTGSVFIGLTATPWRNARSQYLGQWFDEKVIAPQPPDLVRMGKLVPCRIFGFGKAFDLTSLDLGRDGDYQIGQMEAQGTTKAALTCVVNEYQRLAGDRLAAAFCVSVKHAETLCEAFLSAGVAAEWVSGETPEIERKAMFARLDSGQTKVLCSVGTLTAGWNSRPTSCVICVRPTTSKSLFFQMAGRAGRTYPGKTDYMILDFGGNVQRHGSPMGYQDYDISQQSKTRQQVKTHKECFSCHAMISVFSRICPECGQEFVSDDPIASEDERLLEAELVEIFTAVDKEKVKFLRTAKRECFTDGITPDKAVDRFVARYGHIPPREWHFGAVLGVRHSKKRRSEFIAYLESHAKHDYWLKWQTRLEFGFDEQQVNHFVRGQWWSILGIDKDATRSEAKTAYLELAKEYHPDVSTDPDALVKMQAINDAWDKAVRHFASDRKVGL